MKKCLIALLCLVLFSGCSKSSNQINIIYKDSNKQEEILLGLGNSTSQVSNFEFDGSFADKGNVYNIEGKIIFDNNIASSVIKLNLNDIELYLKDKHVYIGYIYNDTKIIIKDELDVFLDELALILKKDVEVIKTYVYEKDIRNFNFENLKYIGKKNGKYIVEDSEYRLELNEKYLPTRIKHDAEGSNASFDLNYKDISISIPLGYDIFPLSIGQVKRILKVDSLVDLF